MQLYIGNKNYSSWSMRPWVLMTQTGIGFEEIKLRLDWNADSPFKKTLLKLAPTGRVPLLVDTALPSGTPSRSSNTSPTPTPRSSCGRSR
jgi:glutathione S-transferase